MYFEKTVKIDSVSNKIYIVFYRQTFDLLYANLISYRPDVLAPTGKTARSPIYRLTISCYYKAHIRAILGIALHDITTVLRQF